jgi:hypothetical protein
MCIRTLDKKPSICIRNKHILSSGRMLYKDYDRNGSVWGKRTCRDLQGAWRQDEMIGGKTIAVK